MMLRFALFMLVAITASAQTGVAPTRTWEELRQETQVRAERNAYRSCG